MLLKIFLIIPAAIYGLIVWVRNLFYDKGILHEQTFDFPIINVGNLAAGGTGKTPHIAFLIQTLQEHYHVAVLSRGYKRTTSGFRSVETFHAEEEVGDEPYLFKLKYPHTNVFVGEDRLLAIPQILQQTPGTDVILLDDAFQHRSVVPGLNILLTEFDRPFFKDFVLPFGYLRDVRSSYKRADIIVVSKCPEHLTEQQQHDFIAKINPLSYQRVFFSTIRYGALYGFLQDAVLPSIPASGTIGLIAGIANINPLLQYVNSFNTNVSMRKYPDHYRFTEDDIKSWQLMFEKDPNTIFITTEKDVVRLIKHRDLLLQKPIPLYVLPIEIHFIGSNKNKFQAYIHQYVYTTLVEIGRIAPPDQAGERFTESDLV